MLHLVLTALALLAAVVVGGLITGVYRWSSETQQLRARLDEARETARAEARGRLVAGEAFPTPWEGRLWGYGGRDGMQVPLDGEVAWLLPGGDKPYWRGHITEIAYEYAQ